MHEHAHDGILDPDCSAFCSHIFLYNYSIVYKCAKQINFLQSFASYIPHNNPHTFFLKSNHFKLHNLVYLLVNNVQSAGLYRKINPFRVIQGFMLGSSSLCRVLFLTNDRLDCTLPNDGKYGWRGDVLLHTNLIRCPWVVERAQVQAFLLGYLSGQFGLVMVPLTLFTTWSQPAARDTNNTWCPALKNTHKQPHARTHHMSIVQTLDNENRCCFWHTDPCIP